ncbi:hypothetical protein IAQ61_004906 [Plenodomus lingam]|uniref:uncharacterized protein n=1 Tax=Leptosphaeria maculans TaxID=5022 RepID=UPI00331BEE50|nr:hypothetical protein IAQ61_004906 [Plenodomus lingam]
MHLLSLFLTLLGFAMATFAAPINTDEANVGINAMCTDGAVICTAAADNGYDGGVFRCVNGRLTLIQDCTYLEKCFNYPSPHCAWPF